MRVRGKGGRDLSQDVADVLRIYIARLSRLRCATRAYTRCDKPAIYAPALLFRVHARRWRCIFSPYHRRTVRASSISRAYLRRFVRGTPGASALRFFTAFLHHLSLAIGSMALPLSRWL